LPKSSVASTASIPAADGLFDVFPTDSPGACPSDKSLARRFSPPSDALLGPATAAAPPLEAVDHAGTAATCVGVESEVETWLAAAGTHQLAAATELCTLPPGMGAEPEGSATANS
jgi:hypothetical protein